MAKFDPTGRTLIWATYLGGDGNDVVIGLTLDSSGNIYVIGTTTSTNFPFTPGSFGTSGQSFAAKMSSDGKRLVYSTSLPLTPVTAQVKPTGELCIAGTGTFTTEGALSVTIPSGPFGSNGYVNLPELNATGSQVVFGAVLGGAQMNGGPSGSSPSSIAFDPQGGIYVAGVTSGGMLSTPTSLQPNYSNTGLSSLGAPLNNGFLIQVDSTATNLLYGTYFGPMYANTAITNVAVGSNGSVYFGGSTNATSYVATPGAFQSAPGGGFIAELSASRTAIQAFSYLPATNLVDLKLASDGSPRCVTKGTYSATFGNQGFTAYQEYLQFAESGLALVASMPLFDVVQLAIDATSDVWLIGTTYQVSNLGGFFVTPNAFQLSFGGGASDAFLVKITTISPTVSVAVSAATGVSHFAPGQLISIYGSQLGPTDGSGLQLGPGGVVTTSSGGTQVLFNGTVAPILYADASQVNAVIPCVLAGQSSVQVVVEYMGAQSAPVTVPLGPAAPGIFTANGSGQGQAAALNQDNSFNSPSNPAMPGSIVTFYATGVGPTSPCVDGQVYQSNFPTIPLPVVVGVGGSGAHVDYAGQAPDLVSGVAQFDVVIPNDATIGVVPLTLVVGGIFSTPGVTIAVK